MNPMVSEIIIGVVLAVIILAFIAPFFTADIQKVFTWVVYHNRGIYKVCYLDSTRETIYVSKSYEVNGTEFVTSSKEEACQIASMLNSIEKINRADAEAAQWHQVKC